MKILTKKLTLIALAALFAVCAAFTATTLIKDVARADDPTVINLTINSVGVNDHNDKAGIYGIVRITALRFTDDQNSSNTGVFSGNTDGVYDWDNLKANTTYIGKSNTFIYAPANVTWPSGYKSSAFNFIYFCTLNQPETGDIVKINAGAYFTMTGTQVYPTSGTCNDKYIIAQEVNLMYNGSAWEICVPAPTETELTFKGIDTWNNHNIGNTYYTKLSFNSGVSTGTANKLSGDFSDLVQKATYTGDGVVSFRNAAYGFCDTGDTKSDDTYNWIIMQTSVSPAQGDTLTLKSGSKFTTGGTINDLYVLAEDVILEFNGTAWEIFIPKVELSFKGIDTWNNHNIGNAYYTKLSFNSGVSTGTANKLSGDYSDLVEKLTYTGDGVVSFRNAAYGFCGTGDTKSDDTYNWIIMQTSVSPAQGDTLTLKSGSKFTTGGTINELYILEEDVVLRFDGNAWVDVNGAVYYIVTFDSNGGSEVESAEILANSAVSEPANPNKAGTADEYYSFEYWYVDDENTPYDFSSAVTEAITLTAKWAAHTREEIEITFNKLNSTWNNYDYDLLGYKKYSIFEFTGGISSGHHGQGMDVSGLVANTTYTGSEVSWGYISSSLIVGPDVENNNMIIFRTSANPATGDTISVKAGAWFIVGGTDTNKYVLSEEIGLRFDGYGWGKVEPFAINGILWNGADQSGGKGTQLTTWGIENDGKDDARPLVGTCALLGTGALSALPTANRISEISGIKYNGTELSEIQGALVSEWCSHLFIYVPYRTGLITIESGTYIGNKYTEEEYNFILNEYSAGAVWVQAKEPQLIDGEWIDLYGKQRVAFASVNYLYNNMRNYGSGESRLVQAILVFDYTEENRPEADENGNVPVLMLGKASNPAPSAVASRITLNGVKLSEIEGASVDYSQGFNYMYIVMPESALLPTDEYPNAKLVIKENSVFEDSVLPEITLTLLGGIWVDTDAESVELPSDGYKTVSDLTGSAKITVGEYDTVMNPLDFDGDLDFRFILSPASLVNDGIPNAYLELCLLSTAEQNWDGFRFDFHYDFLKLAYVLDVYDATLIDTDEINNGGTGLKLLVTIPIGLAAKDYSAFTIKITENDGLYNIIVVENGLKLAEITNVEPRGDRIGNSTLLYALNTAWILSDYKAGDVAVPYVYSLTKEIYFLEEGDAVPNFEYRIYDRTDAVEDVTCELIVDSDAIADGKMKAGEWTFFIRATDKNDNLFEREIKLYVAGEKKYTVTFDGKNGAEYVYGSHIAEPQQPEKTSDKRIYYVFDGWYNGDKKWDFANDEVTSDINLVAKYIEKDVLYAVTFEGDIVESIVIYAKYGAQIDTSFLEREGYKLSLKVDGKSVGMVQVTDNVTVAVGYEEESSEQEEESKESSANGGCLSSIYGSYVAVAALFAAAFIIIKKKERGNE